ncbi:hypothetical protein ABK040_006236 [Willaertia magna]
MLQKNIFKNNFPNIVINQEKEENIETIEEITESVILINNLQQNTLQNNLQQNNLFFNLINIYYSYLILELFKLKDIYILFLEDFNNEFEFLWKIMNFKILNFKKENKEIKINHSILSNLNNNYLNHDQIISFSEEFNLNLISSEIQVENLPKVVILNFNKKFKNLENLEENIEIIEHLNLENLNKIIMSNTIIGNDLDLIISLIIPNVENKKVIEILFENEKTNNLIKNICKIKNILFESITLQKGNEDFISKITI